MSKTFATSDMHFGHRNIIRYCNRPFTDKEAMDTYLINEWNRRVGEEDTTYFVGDLALGATDGDIAQKLRQLNGQIKIILGNHDMPEPKHGNSGLEKVISDYHLHDKVEILPLMIMLRLGGVSFVMCHHPMEKWMDDRRGAVHLHGHEHTEYDKRVALRARRAKKFDIGVDMYGGPVEITADLKHINNPKGWGFELEK